MEEIKKKELELKEKIQRDKNEIHEVFLYLFLNLVISRWKLGKTLEKGMEDIEKQNQEYLNGLRNTITDLNKRISIVFLIIS